MNFYPLIPFLAYTINFSLAFYGFLLNPHRRMNKIFALGFLFVAMWNFADGMMRSSDSYQDALLWSRIMLLAVLFIPSSLLSFSLILTQHVWAEKLRIIMFFYILPFIFSAFFIPYIHEGVIMTPRGYDYVPGSLFPAFSLMYLFVFFFSMFLFYRRYAKASSKSEKFTNLSMLLGFAIPMLLGLFTNIFSRMLGVDVPRLGSFFSVLVSLTFFYAIKRHGLLILPVSERKKEGRPDIKLEKGYSYLVKENMPEKSYSIFRDLVSHGVHGIVIARSPPQKIRSVMGLEKTPVFWLSSIEEEDSLGPQDLSKIIYIVSSFLKESSDSVVLLEGVEYLIYNNTFEDVLKFIHSLCDFIVLNNSRLIVPLYPETISPREMTLIEREMIPL